MVCGAEIFSDAESVKVFGGAFFKRLAKSKGSAAATCKRGRTLGCGFCCLSFHRVGENGLFRLDLLSPNGVAKSFSWHNLHAYPAGTSFCSCDPSGSPIAKHAWGYPETPTLVGRNLRFNRADPPLHYGQPSPLRCALLSPKSLTTFRGPLFARSERLCHPEAWAKQCL